MRTVTVYKSDGNKFTCKPGQVESRNDYDVDNIGTFSEKILKGYYALECEKGSRFYSGYSKEELKRVHQNKIAKQKWRPPIHQD